MTSREFIGTHYVESERPQWNEETMVCLQGQQERCPKTGRLHWQFYVKFKDPKRPKGAGVACGCEGAHMEPRKFKNKDGQMENYGLKSETSIEGTQFTYGTTEKHQGERTDLKSIGRDILDGKKLEEIARESPENFIKFSKGIQALKNTTLKKRDWEMDVRIYWGEAGVGKTRAVYEEFGVENVYSKMENRWWDGYNGEHCVLIDDFNPLDGWITFKSLLKLLDRYPLIIENKGGSTNFCSKTIIFTCNENPEKWFQWLGDRDKKAWDRRITLIKHHK